MQSVENSCEGLTEPIGNIGLLQRCMVGFISHCEFLGGDIGASSVGASAEETGRVLSASLKWASEYDFGDCCALCGCASSVERQVLVRLLERGVPAIVPLAFGYPAMWADCFMRAVAEKRVLIFSLAEYELPWLSSAVLRSKCDSYVLANADRVFLGGEPSDVVLRRRIAERGNVVRLVGG